MLPLFAIAQDHDLEKRADNLKSVETNFTYNCHGTVLYALGLRDIPMMSFDYLGSYLSNNCKKESDASYSRKVFQVYQIEFNGSYPLHSYIEIEDGITFSKDGPDLQKSRNSTIAKENAPYKIKSNCTQIDEDTALARGCSTYTQVFFCRKNNYKYDGSKAIYTKNDLKKKVIEKKETLIAFNQLYPQIGKLSFGEKSQLAIDLNGYEFKSKDKLLRFLIESFLEFKESGHSLPSLKKKFNDSSIKLTDKEIKELRDALSFIEDYDLTIEWSSE